eukprot:comp19266_c0_seq1/m.22070 comp19266_c0_seq1/g.22070  ORF comp19266_c0_seq1/g.22070 comp19266_c0_seq1/m.22070 type:complete len:352 (-) comp19266_c0_seq1:96-1151(-)
MLSVLRRIKATAVQLLYPKPIFKMACRVVNAADIAKPYEDEIRQQVSKLPVAPLLVGFLANKDPAARKYAEWTAKTCTSTGIQFELREVHKMQLEEHIDIANEDPDVNGIIIYYPVFGGGQDSYLMNCVDPLKDVEGLCHLYRHNMYRNVRYLDEAKEQKSILPCTPLALVKVLEHVGAYNSRLDYGNHMYGKTVTIINRSEIVGRPLAALLANDGANVYSVDIEDIFLLTRGTGLKLTKHKVVECNQSLDEILAKSDVVITGVPSKEYKVDTSKLKDGVVCINFATSNNFNADLVEKASLYVKQPGKVTVTMLQRNLLRLCQSQMSRKRTLSFSQPAASEQPQTDEKTEA